jgi:hypothetical protein
VGWLNGNNVIFNPKVKGSNLMSGVVYGEELNVAQIFSYRILIIDA